MKNAYLGLMKGFVVVALALFSVVVNAADYDVEGSFNIKTLSLDLKEKVATSSGCDLFVQRFEYLADVKILNLDLSEVTNCPLDNIAPRKAHFDWNVPFNFVEQKSIYLRVNGRILGTIKMQDKSVRFKPRGN